MAKRVLVLGYGNEGRSDDGIGPYVARVIEKENIPYITTQIVHQLTPELLDDLVQFEYVVFVDAAGVDVDSMIRRVKEPGKTRTSPSTHYVNPEFFYLLTKTLHHLEVQMFACSIRGECFDFGDTLSQGTLDRAQKVIHFIKNILEDAGQY